jgi:hypothetical protein
MKTGDTGIAIIDDGVNRGLFNINDILDDIEITPELHIQQRINNDQLMLSHGTYCAAVIRKYLPFSPLYSIKIINADGRGKTEQLKLALEWCLEKKIKLINISLGTVIYSDFSYIKSIVDYAVSKGLIIVAACNNMDIFTSPASLPNVIGVKCDKSGKLKEGQFVYHLTLLHGIDITAFSEHILIDFRGESQTAPLSNSLAAPYITSIVYDIIRKNKDINIQGMKEELSHHFAVRQEITSENIFFSLCKNIDIPIIGINSEYINTAIEIANKLSGYFIHDGYKTIITSYIKEEKEYFSTAIPIKYYAKEWNNPVNSETLSIINTIYKPDIIIVVLDNDFCSNVSEKVFDISLMVDSGNRVIIPEMRDDELDNPNSINMKKKEFNFSDLDKLYNDILNLFEQVD